LQGHLQILYPDTRLREFNFQIFQAQGIRQSPFDFCRGHFQAGIAGNMIQETARARIGAEKPDRERQEGQQGCQGCRDDKIFQRAFQNSNPTVKWMR